MAWPLEFHEALERSLPASGWLAVPAAVARSCAAGNFRGSLMPPLRSPAQSPVLVVYASAQSRRGGSPMACERSSRARENAAAFWTDHVQ